jgi:hypothetical protein
MRSARVRVPALAVCLCAAACAPGVASSPSPAGEVHGLVVQDVVAGVPPEALPPPAPPFSGRIRFSPVSSTSPRRRALVVLDGRVLKRVPESLDQDRIVKVHVLRNPAATKRYGMRAADGAVVISTRR